MKRICTLIILVFTIQIANGQKSHLETELHSLKEYYEARTKEYCVDDTLKYGRCKEKTDQFLTLRKKYLFKIDSVDRVIRELNESNDGNYYFLKMGVYTNFDWEDCDTKVDSNGRKVKYWSCGSNMIDRIMTIEKIGRSRINSGFSSGQTFYREDIKGKSLP